MAISKNKTQILEKILKKEDKRSCCCDGYSRYCDCWQCDDEYYDDWYDDKYWELDWAYCDWWNDSKESIRDRKLQEIFSDTATTIGDYLNK